MIILLPLFLGLLPSFAWLAFYLPEDPHPEPRRLLLAVFIAGAAFALMALVVQVATYCTSSALIAGIRCGTDELRDVLTGSLTFILLFAAIEELFKFTAAYMVVHKSPAFDEPVDAMIYMIVAALGFAAVENVGVLGSNRITVQSLGDGFELISLRFAGATLIHTVASGLLGYYWAISIREFFAKQFLLVGFVLAVILHVIFNYLVASLGNLFYPIVLALLAGFFVLADFEKLKGKNL